MTRPIAAALLALGATAALAPAGPARAQADLPELRVRGTVERADGDRLTLRRAGGSTVTLRMNPRTRILVANAGELNKVKPESYVGVVAQSDAEPVRARGVAIFSPSERGFEAGRQAWDVTPGGSLVAGWITEFGGGDPRRLTLTYEGGSTRVEIPAGTPVTQVSPGEKALLVPGAAVTAIGHSGEGGALEAGVVVVGRLGVVPTL